MGRPGGGQGVGGERPGCSRVGSEQEKKTALGDIDTEEELCCEMGRHPG